jgi:hypothetical protein
MYNIEIYPLFPVYSLIQVDEEALVGIRKLLKICMEMDHEEKDEVNTKEKVLKNEMNNNYFKSKDEHIFYYGPKSLECKYCKSFNAVLIF